jgi:hypothetical protein
MCERACVCTSKTLFYKEMVLFPALSTPNTPICAQTTLWGACYDLSRAARGTSEGYCSCEVAMWWFAPKHNQTLLSVPSLLKYREKKRASPR